MDLRRFVDFSVSLAFYLLGWIQAPYTQTSKPEIPLHFFFKVLITIIFVRIWRIFTCHNPWIQRQSQFLTGRERSLGTELDTSVLSRKMFPKTISFGLHLWIYHVINRAFHRTQQVGMISVLFGTVQSEGPSDRGSKNRTMPLCPQDNVQKLSIEYESFMCWLLFTFQPDLCQLPASFYMDHTEHFIVSSFTHVLSQFHFSLYMLFSFSELVKKRSF